MGRKSDVARGRAHVSGLGAKTPTIRLVFGLRRSVRERWSPSRGMTTPWRSNYSRHSGLSGRSFRNSLTSLPISS